MSTPTDILAMAELAGVPSESVRPAARVVSGIAVASGGSATTGFTLSRPGVLFVCTRIELEGYPRDGAGNPILGSRLGNPGSPYGNAYLLTVTKAGAADAAAPLVCLGGDTFIVFPQGVHQLSFALAGAHVPAGVTVVLWGRLYGFHVPESAAAVLSGHEMVIL